MQNNETLATFTHPFDPESLMPLVLLGVALEVFPGKLLRPIAYLLAIGPVSYFTISRWDLARSIGSHDSFNGR